MQIHLLLLCLFITLSATPSLLRAADTATTDPDGVVTWTASKPAPHLQSSYKPTRWGMYDVEAHLDAPAAGGIKLTLGDKQLEGTAEATSATVKLGRTYIDTETQRPLAIDTSPADSAKPLLIKSITFTPAPEGKPIVQSGDLSITLHAHDATVHASTLRYEFRPDKNTLGYWSNPKDWVSWDFDVQKPGKFNVVVMQGSPGAKEIQITCDKQTLDWTTKNTHSFHTFTFLEIGTLTFDTPGPKTLTLKPTAPKGPIMDLRQIILLPILK